MRRVAKNPTSVAGRLVKLLDGMTSAVVWEGPSQIDGAPLVVVATRLVPDANSANRKTGDAAQLYILRRDIGPLDALRSGHDFSICGRCMHRPKVSGLRTCYPDIRMINRVWTTYRLGSYPYITSDRMLRTLFEERPVRFGAYGDPAAVDPIVLQTLDEISPFAWGYTHQWREPEAGACLELGLMASVESEAERAEANAMGFRTFRVRPHVDSPLLSGERLCPADAELARARRWKKTSTCVKCRWCNRHSKMSADVSVVAHGNASVRLATVLESRLPIVPS